MHGVSISNSGVKAKGQSMEMLLYGINEREGDQEEGGRSDTDDDPVDSRKSPNLINLSQLNINVNDSHITSSSKINESHQLSLKNYELIPLEDHLIDMHKKLMIGKSLKHSNNIAKGASGLPHQNLLQKKLLHHQNM